MSAFRSIILVWDILTFWGIVLAGDISAFLLVKLLGQCLSNARNDVLVGVPYASSDEFTEFLFKYTGYPYNPYNMTIWFFYADP